MTENAVCREQHLSKVMSAGKVEFREHCSTNAMNCKSGESDSGQRIGHALDSNIWRSRDAETTDCTFADLNIDPLVVSGMNKCNLLRPSTVQLKAIPLGRFGVDLVVQSKAGTGKTCVFAVIALETVEIECNLPQALILSPTREIALQVSQVIRAISADMKGLSCKTFIGGTKMKNDIQSLKKCHIAVGTPGRVKQLIESGLLKTSSIRLLVLDEADKLMDDNFSQQMDDIYKLLPESKQIIVTSATYPNELSTFLSRYMKTPNFVTVNDDERALVGVTQYVQYTNYNPINHLAFDQKMEPLLLILNSVAFSQCIIFSNYHSRAQSLCERLIADGWPTAYISGDQLQKERCDVIAKVKNATYRVLVATDLISRGVDCENVNLVINLDVPESTETYLHRIGRAGRFGQKGLAITLATDGSEKGHFEKIVRNQSLIIYDLPDLKLVDLWSFNDPERHKSTTFDAEKLWYSLFNRRSENGEIGNKTFSELLADYLKFAALLRVNEGELIPLKSMKVRKLLGYV